MTDNTITTLKALRDAGEKATQGRWAVESYANAARTPTAIASIIKGKPVYLFDLFGGVAQKNERTQDAKFVALAANTRPAIDQAIKLLEARQVDVEGLKIAAQRRVNEDGFEWADDAISPKQEGWNDCLDHLISQGILTEKET